MPTKTNKVTKKPTHDVDLMQKTIANLTDVVSDLQNDVKKIKIRMGI